MNHLSTEQSPYLLQHAHQPVDWFPWGDQAFAKAKSENKPILLSIGYATCHWCHVMAHESFDDPNVAKELNTHFISIKLDREERPDLDHIYMTAVSAITGQGGWPLNVFLTPEGKPFYGGTYFPPQAKWGVPGFLDLLISIREAWQNNQGELINSANDLLKSVAQHMSSPREGQDTLTESMMHHAYEQIAGDYDRINGGFGSMPKFPMGHVLWFLSRYYFLTGLKPALDSVEHTLNQMAKGGIWDHLGGGFHRYSVDSRWHVPHFEKMLYDQAILLRCYIEGYQLTGSTQYARIAHDIAGFVMREMTHPQGGFYCAYDADSQDSRGHLTEGAYYVFTWEEINAALGDDAPLFMAAYDCHEDGNVKEDPHGEFVKQNVLMRVLSDDILSNRFKLSVEEVQQRLQAAQDKLLVVRQARPKPFLDDKILTDLNGLMISALCMASNALNEPTYALAAKKAADFIWDNLWINGRLKHRWRGAQAAFNGTLDDYARFADGLVSLYEATYDEVYLERAKIMMNIIYQHFSDPQGGFFMTADDQADVLIRPKDVGDGAIPSANSMAAIVCVRLLALSGEDIYQTMFAGICRYYAKNMQFRAAAFAGLWSAWMHQEHGIEILFHGDTEQTEIAKMRKVLYKEFRPFVASRATPGETACAYVCRDKVCHMPVTTVEAFIDLLGAHTPKNKS